MALVYIALAWAAGLWLASQFPVVEPFSWLLVGVGGVAAWLMNRRIPRWRLFFALIAAAGIAASRMASEPDTSGLAALNGSGGATVEGEIIDPPDMRDLYVQVRVAVDRVAVTGNDQPTDGLVVARIPVESGVSYGDRIRITGRLRTPDEGDAFSYADYLARQDVFSLLDRVSDVEVVSSGHGYPWVAWAVQLRDRVREHISSLQPEPHAGILTAVLTGDERGISPQTEEAYAASGIAHLLAVSGFNMTLVGGFAAAQAKRADTRSWLWVLVGIMLLGTYTMLVGFAPSAFRAALMAGLVLGGNALKRTAYVPVSLAVAFLLLTAIDPNTVFDLGFQLSFGAVLGISLIGSPLAKRLAWLTHPDVPNSLQRGVLAVLADALIVTIAASVLTMPLIGLAFGRLPLVSFVSNVLVVPVQPAVMILGVIAVITAGVPLVSQGAAWIALVPLAWTTSVARVTAQAPEMALNLHQAVVGAGFGVAVAASIVSATRPPWLEWARTKQARLTAAAGALTVGVLAIGIVTSRPDGQLHVWVLDVGHSHAVLIQTPDGAQILIDGGRYPSRLLTAIGDRLPFNDTDLSAVILTQPDPAEIGAVSAVLRRYAVDTVYTTGQPNLGPEMAEIASLVPLTPLAAGYTLDTGDGVIIEVLHPQTTPDISDPLDDVAMVLRVRYGEISFLLGGEASRTAQSALLDAGYWPLSTVLVLPKHGGTIDGDFLDAVQPSVIVVQSDRANLLGHPNPDVLESLPDVPLYRTDIHGALQFTTDGIDLYVTKEH
jgi:competence protein ComEC